MFSLGYQGLSHSKSCACVVFYSTLLDLLMPVSFSFQLSLNKEYLIRPHTAPEAITTLLSLAGLCFSTGFCTGWRRRRFTASCTGFTFSY